MTGIDSYSTTALTNETFDGTSTWKEGQLPSTVNNSARQVLADLRARFNDLPWFQYGNGDQDTSTHLAKPCVYSSATAFTVAGNGDQTAYYHAGRPIRAVGSTTGTIYGVIASSSYSAGNDTNTVNVTWASGSLSNETLVISAGLPITGAPAGTVTIAIEHTISNGGSVLDTGITGGTRVPFACTIKGWCIICDQSGSVVFDIWKKAFVAGSPPTVAGTITASAKPTVSSAKSAASTTLTGWTTAIAENDELRFNIDSASTVTWATLILTCTKP